MTTHERIGEQRKVDKRGEHDIKFAEPCQDAAEYPLDSTALIVQLPVVFAVLSALKSNWRMSPSSKARSIMTYLAGPQNSPYK